MVPLFSPCKAFQHEEGNREQDVNHIRKQETFHSEDRLQNQKSHSRQAGIPQN